MSEFNRWLNVFGSFNFLGFEMKIECSQSVYDDPNSEAMSVLTHEYIHYLQAVKTPYGIKRTLVLIRSMLRVFSVIHKNNNLTIPLEQNSNPEFKSALLQYEQDLKRFNLGVECIPIKVELEKYRLFTRDYPDILHARVDTIYHIPNQTKTHWVPLSQVSFEETMATIAMFTYERKDSREIYDLLTNLPLSEEYKAIYIYFYETFPSLSNHAEFVFKFCELCLMHTDPNSIAGRVFNFVVEKINKSHQLDFDSIYEEFLTKESKEHFEAELRKLREALDSNIKSFEHFADYNYFGECSLYLSNLLKAGLESIQPRSSIWHPTFNETWRIDSVKMFGCPLISLNEGKPFVYIEEKSKYSESVSYVFSIVHMFNSIIKHEVKQCPFYKGICDASIKNPAICLREPLNIPEDADGTSCIFRNSIMIMGLSDMLRDLPNTTSHHSAKISRNVAGQLTSSFSTTLENDLNTILNLRESHEGLLNRHIDAGTAISVAGLIVSLSALAWDFYKHLKDRKEAPTAHVIILHLEEKLREFKTDLDEIQLRQIINEVTSQTLTYGSTGVNNDSQLESLLLDIEA